MEICKKFQKTEFNIHIAAFIQTHAPSASEYIPEEL